MNFNTIEWDSIIDGRVNMYMFFFLLTCLLCLCHAQVYRHNIHIVIIPGVYNIIVVNYSSDAICMIIMFSGWWVDMCIMACIFITL